MCLFSEDLIDLGEPSIAAEENAAFGASASPPEEERSSALGLLDPIAKTEPEEPTAYDGILASLEATAAAEEGEHLAASEDPIEAAPVADHSFEETQDAPEDAEVKDELDSSLESEPAVDPVSTEVFVSHSIPGEEELHPPPTSRIDCGRCCFERTSRSCN